MADTKRRLPMGKPGAAAGRLHRPKPRPFGQKRTRFHFIYTLRFLKYGLALSVLPLLNILLRWDWASLTSALLQDLLILLGMGAVAFAMWWLSECSWDGETLVVRTGLVYIRRQAFHERDIAVVELYRPLYCRLLGATVATVYFTSGKPRSKVKIYLTKRQAQRLANSVLPITGKTDAAYKVEGLHRAVFVLLSANVISTAVITFFSYRQIADLLGEQRQVLESLAITGILTLEQIFEIVLPTGAAVVAAIITVVALITLLRSFLSTVNYTTARHGALLVQRSGLVAKTERRIRTDCMGYVDIRHTPLSRLLRHRAVYITSGGYNGNATPIAICKNEHDPLLQSLLPGYEPRGPVPVANRYIKSLLVYIWIPGSLLVLFFLLLLTASQAVPFITPLLAIPCFLFLGSLLAHVDGYFTEGAAARPGGGIWASYTRFFTRHSIVLLTNQLSLTVSEAPVGGLQGRVTLRIYTPARNKIRIRGIGRTTALEMRFTR